MLKSGGYIIFEETEALISVDVNTGRHKGASTQEEVILEVNTEAAEEVARQLRLRNVGGLLRHLALLEVEHTKLRMEKIEFGRVLVEHLLDGHAVHVKSLPAEVRRHAEVDLH